MKPMWTVAVSAMTMTLSVAVMAMVRFAALTWMVGVWAVSGGTRRAAASMSTERRGSFIVLFLWNRWRLRNRAERQGFVCASAWRLVFVWGRAGRAQAAVCRGGRGRWP